MRILHYYDRPERLAAKLDRTAGSHEIVVPIIVGD
jgi:hypothetical protein